MAMWSMVPLASGFVYYPTRLADDKIGRVDGL